MPVTSIGNMSQSFITQRQNIDLRTRLNELTSELSSGRKSDLTRSLGSDTTRFSHIDRRIDLLASYERATDEVAQTLTITQQVLSTVGDLRESLSSDILTADFMNSPAQREARMANARDVFASMVSALNTRYADNYVMSGNESDQRSLAASEDLMAQIELDLSGLTSVDDIDAALDTWFDDPTGGFATMGYTGDTGALSTRRIDEGESITLYARADATEIKSILKATAKAFVGESLGLTSSGEAELLRTAALDLVDAGEPFYQLASRVGSVEERVETLRVRHQSESSALSQLYNEMIGADPYETATILQDVQTQLETHYTLTARLSQLSLTEYLR